MILLKRKFSFLLCVTLSLVLMGCLHSPDHFTPNRVQVEEKAYSEAVSVSEIHEDSIRKAADHYSRHGDGPFDLTITYDPALNSGAMRASDEAARLAGLLRKNGVEDIQASILPVKDTGDDIKALFSYTAYNALAPADCDMMPGIAQRAIEAEEGYKLGCSVETLYARQIARPKDLKGQGVMDPQGDGRRASNIVDTYRSGVPNKPLEGEGASKE